MGLKKRFLNELEWYSPEELLTGKVRFPHYKRWETMILKEFLRRRLLPGKYALDVKLYVEEGRSDIWRELTAKRIDALCMQKDKLWILEIKDRTRPSGIGELLMYEVLLKEQFFVDLPVLKAAVVGWGLKKEFELYERNGIVVYCLNMPFPSKGVFKRL